MRARGEKEENKQCGTHKRAQDRVEVFNAIRKLLFVF